MPMPTLKELDQMASQMRALEGQAQRAVQRAEELRRCGGKTHVGDWYLARVHSYSRNDYDGMTKILEEGLAEFGPAILETLARRQELAAHQAVTAAVLKRAELGTFVTLEADRG